MAKRDFVAAAVRQDEEDGEVEAEVLEFTLADEEFVADKATTSQVALIAAATEDGGVAMIAAVMRFLEGVLQDDGFSRLRKLVAQGRVPLELLIGGDEENEQGIVDWIVDKSSDRPTKPPTDYLPSRKTGGQRSTGRVPGKGSVRSASPSPAS